MKLCYENGSEWIDWKDNKGRSMSRWALDLQLHSVRLPEADLALIRLTPSHLVFGAVTHSCVFSWLFTGGGGGCRALILGQPSMNQLGIIGRAAWLTRRSFEGTRRVEGHFNQLEVDNIGVLFTQRATLGHGGWPAWHLRGLERHFAPPNGQLGHFGLQKRHLDWLEGLGTVGGAPWLTRHVISQEGNWCQQEELLEALWSTKNRLTRGACWSTRRTLRSTTGACRLAQGHNQTLQLTTWAI